MSVRSGSRCASLGLLPRSSLFSSIRKSSSSSHEGRSPPFGCCSLRSLIGESATSNLTRFGVLGVPSGLGWAKEDWRRGVGFREGPLATGDPLTDGGDGGAASSTAVPFGRRLWASSPSREGCLVGSISSSLVAIASCLTECDETRRCWKNRQIGRSMMEKVRTIHWLSHALTPSTGGVPTSGRAPPARTTSLLPSRTMYIPSQ